MEKQYRYLINNTLMQGGEMPNRDDYEQSSDVMYHYDLEQWRQSLVKLECSESELGRIIGQCMMTGNAGNIVDGNINSIDITLITTVKSNCCGRCDGHNDECDGKLMVYFKESESESQEAVFAHWILHNYKPYEDGMTMVWRNINPDIDTIHTSKQLYEIFKHNQTK